MELLVPMTWEPDADTETLPAQLDCLVKIKKSFALEPIIPVILNDILKTLSVQHK